MDLHTRHSRLAVWAFVVIFAVGCFTALNSLHSDALVSSELGFTDKVAQAHLVPASCPSDAHYAGECDPLVVYCTPPKVLSGNACVCPVGTTVSGASCIAVTDCPPGQLLINGVCTVASFCPAGSHLVGEVCVVDTCPPGQIVNGAGVCQTTVITCPVGYSLIGGVCTPLAGCVINGTPVAHGGSMSYLVSRVNDNEGTCVDTTANRICTNGVVTGSDQTDTVSCLPGDVPDGTNRPAVSISTRPSIVRAGQTTKVTWRSRNTNSCTVTGTNGDGGAAGGWTRLVGIDAVSGPINQKTTYTAVCTSARGVTVTARATVNILPVFREQ
jgi:hypothetical protein